jgi:hypothetical protein
MKEKALQFLVDVAEAITNEIHYWEKYNGGNAVHYEKGKYVIENRFIDDLQDLKKFLTSLGIVCSNISTGQSRHNCGRKYLKIDGMDEALLKIILNENEKEIIHFECSSYLDKK